MIVALRAADRQAEPDRAGRGHAIEDAVDAKLFLVDAPFLIDLRVAMKPVAIFWLSVASGSRSPASCSMVN